MGAVIRCALNDDVDNLMTFLERAGLSTDGVEGTIDSFLIMEDEKGNIQATIGIEQFGKVGLLRSLVMTSQTMKNDVYILFEQIFLLASEKGMKDIFMATNKIGAVKLVELLGFQQIKKTELPPVLSQAGHVQHVLTVDNSIFLKISL
ncbi:GNAT family N-acetyltransferase [Niallia endozanthoxylica]|uniref:N-acetyltransferase domain-containing protein n=1 Tax=Niallia endozanthoxylica TaxID=2036016 RepID=A0A5J5HXY7_9BACI|nr:hypothetical protein [Niallia endozanthoxylica]KAA9027838.1 hypothetical protein F4V44_05295 [Niallia endozanthoxylica]